MKNIIWAIIIVLAFGGLIWSNKKEGPSTEKPIRIGAILSQTGVAAAFGEMSRLGMEMAVKEINDNGGVDGRLIEVIYEDDHTDPKTAVGSYQKLTSVDNVDVVIGSNFDFVTQPLFALAKETGTVIVSPSNPRIPGAFDTNSHSFVMMSDFSKIVMNMRSYLSDSSYKKMAVIHFKSEFANEVKRNLALINDELGKPKIIEESYNQIGSNDFRTVILKLKQAGVDLVFLDMVAQDPITFVNQSKQLNFSPQSVTYDGITDSLAVEGVDKSLFNGIVILNWNVVTDEFSKKFKEAYNLDPKNSVNRAYDAVFILAKAVSMSKDRSEIPAILESTKFETPNGDFRFTPEHAALDTSVAVQTLQDGKLINIK